MKRRIITLLFLLVLFPGLFPISQAASWSAAITNVTHNNGHVTVDVITQQAAKLIVAAYSKTGKMLDVAVRSLESSPSTFPNHTYEIIELESSPKNELVAAYLLDSERCVPLSDSFKTNCSEEYLADDALEPSLYYSASSSASLFGTSDSNGGVFHFYLPADNGKHIRVSFIHGTRQDYNGIGSPNYHNENVFRLEKGTSGRLTATGFQPEQEIITSGAWEAAIYKNNTGSAVGTFHGWERFSRCKIFADGAIIADLTPLSCSVPEIELKPAKTITIQYWSNVYQLPPYGITDEVPLLDAYRHYSITGNTITLEQKNTWKVSGIHGIFTAMGCVNRALTNRLVCDFDGCIYDITNQSVTPLSGFENARKDISYAEEFGTNSGVDFAITVFPPCSFYVNNLGDAKYNKLYFRNVRDTTVNDTWYDKTVFEFRHCRRRQS